jgi:hypothetical protein
LHNPELAVTLLAEGKAMVVAGVRRVAVALVLSASVCMGACAQITVVSDQAPPKTEWKFGVLAVDLGQSNKNTIVESKGIGIVSTPSGATLGYANAKVVRLGNECRVVISTRDFESVRNDPKLLSLLKSTRKACAA